MHKQLYAEMMDELAGPEEITQRDRVLCFALLLLAEDNEFYGTVEDMLRQL